MNLSSRCFLSQTSHVLTYCVLHGVKVGRRGPKRITFLSIASADHADVSGRQEFDRNSSLLAKVSGEKGERLFTLTCQPQARQKSFFFHLH